MCDTKIRKCLCPPDDFENVLILLVSYEKIYAERNKMKRNETQRNGI